VNGDPQIAAGPVAGGRRGRRWTGREFRQPGRGLPAVREVHMGRLREIRARREAGMATAEYAVATVAACGFAGTLIKLLSSKPIVEMLLTAVTHAFHFAF
jgi:hypothetical protein